MGGVAGEGVGGDMVTTVEDEQLVPLDLKYISGVGKEVCTQPRPKGPGGGDTCN